MPKVNSTCHELTDVGRAFKLTKPFFKDFYAMQLTDQNYVVLSDLLTNLYKLFYITSIISIGDIFR